MSSKSQQTTHIRPMNDEDIELVLTWRNHPEIRRYMYTQHQVTLDEHKRWFESTSKNSKKHILIFEQKGTPQGFINISQVDSSIADWGFYTAPDAPKGAGSKLANEAIFFGFKKLGLHKLCGQALAYNIRSIQFHKKLGFKQEGILREHHFDGKNYHDIVCFGLLSTEWSGNS